VRRKDFGEKVEGKSHKVVQIPEDSICEVTENAEQFCLLLPDKR
jgi:hypothetical protein